MALKLFDKHGLLVCAALVGVAAIAVQMWVWNSPQPSLALCPDNTSGIIAPGFQVSSWVAPPSDHYVKEIPNNLAGAHFEGSFTVWPGHLRVIITDEAGYAKWWNHEEVLDWIDPDISTYYDSQIGTGGEIKSDVIPPGTTAYLILYNPDDEPAYVDLKADLKGC